MLWAIALILLILWTVGLATGSTVTGALQVLAVVAVAMILIGAIKSYRRRHRR